MIPPRRREELPPAIAQDMVFEPPDIFFSKFRLQTRLCLVFLIHQIEVVFFMQGNFWFWSGIFWSWFSFHRFIVWIQDFKFGFQKSWVNKKWWRNKFQILFLKKNSMESNFGGHLVLCHTSRGEIDLYKLNWILSILKYQIFGLSPLLNKLNDYITKVFEIYTE